MNDVPAAGDPIKVAVITGHHPFDVIDFQELFRGMPGLECYHQNMEEFINDTGRGMSSYDVLLFYCMHKQYPKDCGFLNEQKIKEALGKLGESKQGLFILHHALCAFPDWEWWSEICGIHDRGVQGISFDTIEIQVAEPAHPITRGMDPWRFHDELYLMQNAGDGCEVLLTTNHPQSMKTIAWTRRFKNAKVFCYQSGHDAEAFTEANFIRIVARGLLWLAGREEILILPNRPGWE